MSRFNSVILDVDSSLSGIEGIDWLASLRGTAVEARSVELTEKAMLGQIPLEAVYGERLKAIRPTLSEVEDLSRVYVAEMAPRARETLSALLAHDVDVVLVSGGFQQAILPLATELGLNSEQVYAVLLFFDHTGGYAGFDEHSLLARQNGKRDLVAALNLPKPALAVGDGMTDCEIKPIVDAFAVYTGFVRREPVVKRADYVLENFDQLRELVLG